MFRAKDGDPTERPELHRLVVVVRPRPVMTKFYNGRGAAEQWIKEGKHAINWTRLSCHSFRNNAVRLQLHTLTYNLGNFLRTLALPQEAPGPYPQSAKWSLEFDFDHQSICQLVVS